uniref:Macroglobulin complement-related protein n=1 Tax=Pararge aegeria TaxID=116150 RepID=S4P554_9NEOP
MRRYSTPCRPTYLTSARFAAHRSAPTAPYTTRLRLYRYLYCYYWLPSSYYCGTYDRNTTRNGVDFVI